MVVCEAGAVAALPGPCGGRTRTKLANALANCAVVSVQRAEQLVSRGEPAGVRRFIHITAFPQSKFTGCLQHVYPQPADGRRKEGPRETHRIVQKPHRIGVEIDLCPDFIGKLINTGTPCQSAGIISSMSLTSRGSD